jgi:hypothetical protein
MYDQNGNQLAHMQQSGSHGAQSQNCADSAGWTDGYHQIELSAPVDSTVDVVRVEITNTLNQGVGDESIGYGNLNL